MISLDPQWRQKLERFIRRIASEVISTKGSPFWGLVASVDPTRPAVRVQRMPDGELTGWLPVLGTAQTGATIPVVGWQAYIVPDQDDAEHGVVCDFAHSDA